MPWTLDPSDTVAAWALVDSANCNLCKFSAPVAFIFSLFASCNSILAATPFLLANAAWAKAVAPPALAPLACNVSNVLANAISASSACIFAPWVATPKLL